MDMSDINKLFTFLFSELPIRLVGGITPGEGRLEVYYNNSWGRVCNDGWSNTEATIVCKQLIGNIYTGYKANFGPGSGAIVLNKVDCNSSQSSIFDCRHNGFGNHDCSRGIAGVRCSGSHSKFYCYSAQNIGICHRTFSNPLQ